MKRSHSEAFTNVLSTEAKKIVLLGDGCIGKSTFFDKMNNLNNEDYRFPKKYRATDNFDFNRLAINTNKDTLKHQFKRFIWLGHTILLMF